MITPAYLKSGDTIGIVAPARKADKAEVEKVSQLIVSMGYKVAYGKNLFGANNQFSGTDRERADDIQNFIDNQEIRAIFCARGGYGSVRTLPLLDWTNFKQNPKWFIGYSDITAFHAVINNFGIESLHAPMVINVANNAFDTTSTQLMFSCLRGELPEYTFAGNKRNHEGKAKGQLIGGNLSVLYSLRGTPADIKMHGKILFIEDIDEYLYHIDRMMMNLHYGGQLGRLRAIVVGDLTDMKDNSIPFGKDAYDIIAQHTEALGIPVCFGFSAGHGEKNLPLFLGKEVVLNIGTECQLTFL